MNTKLFAGLFLAVLASATHAADTGAFTTLDLGMSRLDQPIGPGIGADRTDTTIGIGGGYMFTPYFGLEGGYRKLGKNAMSSPGSVTGTFLGKPLVTTGAYASSTNTDGFYLGPVLNYALNPQVSLGARAGMYFWSNSANVSGAGLLQYNGTFFPGGTNLRLKNSGQDEYWGLSGSYRLRPNLDVGLNYNRFKADSRAFDVWDVRLKFSF